MKVTEELTLKVAHLARLELSEGELRSYTEQLSQVLGYVESLQQVQVEGIEPLTHPLEKSAQDSTTHLFGAYLRKDEVVPPQRSAQGKPKILESAPEVLYDGFKVPQIL